MPEDGCCPERDNSCMFRCRGAIVIGKRLKISRVRADLTQAELGVSAGLDEESASARISSYEKEVHAPDFKLVCKLAAALDVPEAYFYAADDELAELILQYHRIKKKNPDAVLVITSM
ncbi:helix-turn-helix transcriptional regulator [Klebsiella michiganensis]|uniref:helix-turn-helix domain-containing protein n=1 Tax=Klebsiella TaxID=570 RepID=UPI001B82C8E6|nr:MULTISPECIES: helix-turn-helix transcriptional regulator [Klebsiella]MBR7530116.1 helix-turn-helix transcriptional regulator [Klebsiella michiganensis]MBR7572323.1 helix-turn-helix transcriptional regulator [Klebsiella michiganensis]MDM4222405.1 helix-turn-helix transcriptional regulator [Klebsiella pasteurii]